MPFRVSASQLRAYSACPRSWWLKSVARAPDDEGAGGLYLTRGNDFDRLVQAYAGPGGRVGDPLATKLANRQLAVARPHLPPPGAAQVQYAYDLDDGTGTFRVCGKPDLRRRGFIQDTKTTSDRGPGVGAASDRPAYALTNVTLRDDVQARLYAWCEFTLDPTLLVVTCEWIYVSKADAPRSWVARCQLGRAEVLAWFESFVRPTVAEMMRLAADATAGLTAESVSANPDACRRCFVQRACPGPYEGRNIYQIGRPPGKREANMAFDLNRLRQAPAAPAAPPPPPAPDLEAQLAASVAAVAINRPPSQRPAPPPAALAVTTVEGPGAALLVVDTEGEDVTDAAPPAEETPPAPKARRGRPKKAAPSSTPSTDTVPDVTPSETPPSVGADPKAPTPDTTTPTVPGCVSSVGGQPADVSALARDVVDAVARLVAAVGGVS